ncbi:putative Zinc finger, BED-type [Corchorus olitorius]|uniref:Zinc finger, BED-type n=1 Tax=Corchorus olitorius TaxID=93759 RepID=A0A1R3J4X4_9ROSI|nr:putative Zinc finger, BED-type [Corchorus olitorius]
MTMSSANNNQDPAPTATATTSLPSGATKLRKIPMIPKQRSPREGAEKSDGSRSSSDDADEDDEDESADEECDDFGDYDCDKNALSDRASATRPLRLRPPPPRLAFIFLIDISSVRLFSLTSSLQCLYLNLVTKPLKSLRHSVIYLKKVGELVSGLTGQDLESSLSSQRKRRRTSNAWSIFQETKEKAPDGKPLAKCKCCGKLQKYDSKYGTGNLKRPVGTCVKRDTKDVGQMIIDAKDESITVKSSKFDPLKLRELAIVAIVMHNLPLAFVEYKGFLSYCLDGRDVGMVSRNTAKSDLLKLHAREKGKVIT